MLSGDGALVWEETTAAATSPGHDDEPGATPLSRLSLRLLTADIDGVPSAPSAAPCSGHRGLYRVAQVRRRGGPPRRQQPVPRQQPGNPLHPLLGRAADLFPGSGRGRHGADRACHDVRARCNRHTTGSRASDESPCSMGACGDPGWRRRRRNRGARSKGPGLNRAGRLISLELRRSQFRHEQLPSIGRPARGVAAANGRFRPVPICLAVLRPPSV